MAVRIVGEVKTEPIKMATVYEHIREDVFEEGTEEYILLKSYIASARAYLEDFTGRSFCLKTYKLTMDKFPGRMIRLPFPPLQEVISFQYTDKEGIPHEIDQESYIIDTESFPARIVLKTGCSWPTNLQEINSVQITFKAGHEELPNALQQAMLLLIGHMYEERQPVIVGTSVETLPFSISALTWPYRVWGVDT